MECKQLQKYFPSTEPAHFGMEQKDFMHTSRFITHVLKGQDLIKLIFIAPPRTSEIGIFVVKLQTSGDEECRVSSTGLPCHDPREGTSTCPHNSFDTIHPNLTQWEKVSHIFILLQKQFWPHGILKELCGH